MTRLRGRMGAATLVLTTGDYQDEIKRRTWALQVRYSSVNHLDSKFPGLNLKVKPLGRC